MPAFRDQWPEGFRYPQPLQIFFVVDGAADEFEAHRVDVAGGRFDLSLDLIRRERIVRAFIPIALAVDGMKIKSAGFGGDAPVVSFRANDALHRRWLAAAMGMAVAVAVQAMRRASEAAGYWPAIRSAARSRLRGQAGTAAGSRHKPRRYRADHRGPHHRQNDTARALHGAAQSCKGEVCKGEIGRHHSGTRAAIRQVFQPSKPSNQASPRIKVSESCAKTCAGPRSAPPDTRFASSSSAMRRSTSPATYFENGPRWVYSAISMTM